MAHKEKPQILLTNDDSINSPGLWAAAKALAPLGFVHVVAPRVQQTSMGRSHPPKSDGQIEMQRLVVDGKEWEVYGVGGSPAQAFLHGYHQVLGETPDLVVSGINYGENVGSGVTVSGTIGAALEAATVGIPALAISLQTPTSENYSLSQETDFSTAAFFTHYFAKRMLSVSLPFDVSILKVEVPNKATPETPWVVTRQSRERYYYYLPGEPKSKNGFYNMDYEIRLIKENIESDSDIYALRFKNMVSVTPLSFDLTSRVDLDKFSEQLHG